MAKKMQNSRKNVPAKISTPKVDVLDHLAISVKEDTLKWKKPQQDNYCKKTNTNIFNYFWNFMKKDQILEITVIIILQFLLQYFL